MTALDFVTSHLLENHPVQHAFTTRGGGVSHGVYGSLNLTRSRGDKPENVAENRERVRRALGFDYLAFATQVHGRAVAQLTEAPRGDQPVGEADALITDRCGIGLVCQTADCTPILLLDPVNRAVGAIHSGWRGTVQNIVAATIDAMRAAYGSRPANLLAAIGPSVSPANYRVGPEVVAQFETYPAGSQVLGTRDAEGGAQLDVARACELQLLEAGLRPEHVDRSPLCTYAEHDRLFSARRAHHQGESGLFGGQGGVIGWASDP